MPNFECRQVGDKTDPVLIDWLENSRGIIFRGLDSLVVWEHELKASDWIVRDGAGYLRWFSDEQFKEKYQ